MEHPLFTWRNDIKRISMILGVVPEANASDDKKGRLFSRLRSLGLVLGRGGWCFHDVFMMFDDIQYLMILADMLMTCWWLLFLDGMWWSLINWEDVMVYYVEWWWGGLLVLLLLLLSLFSLPWLLPTIMKHQFYSCLVLVCYSVFTGETQRCESWRKLAAGQIIKDHTIIKLRAKHQL